MNTSALTTRAALLALLAVGSLAAMLFLGCAKADTDDTESAEGRVTAASPPGPGRPRGQVHCELHYLDIACKSGPPCAEVAVASFEQRILSFLYPAFTTVLGNASAEAMPYSGAAIAGPKGKGDGGFSTVDGFFGLSIKENATGRGASSEGAVSLSTLHPTLGGAPAGELRMAVPSFAFRNGLYDTVQVLCFLDPRSTLAGLDAGEDTP